MIMEKIISQLKKLPDTPGVYLFFDAQKNLIYVGKATSLHDRVRSYFRGARTSRPIEQMIHLVADIKHKPTDSVLEAMILEGRLIKKSRPKYNIDWRDDKSWNYIVITKEKYPHIATLREHELKQLSDLDKKFQYVFGPYPGLNTAATLKILRKIFRFSTCKAGQNRPCLYRQMGECLGACTGEISAKDYRQKVIKPLVLFLSGKKKSLLRGLGVAMVQASKLKNYEEASRLRDQIKSLQRIQDIAMLNASMVSEKNYANESVVRIEGYDISNLGTQDKVGSMVVFDESGPVKSHYRKFNIKTVSGQSDVDCLAEVLARRLRHSEWPMPDVFLIDGGLPQAHTAMKILHAHQIDLPVVGIAKGPTRRQNTFIVQTKNITWKNWIYGHQKLLIQVRDEAHRFAIAFNRSKRKLF